MTSSGHAHFLWRHKFTVLNPNIVVIPIEIWMWGKGISITFRELTCKSEPDAERTATGA